MAKIDEKNINSFLLSRNLLPDVDISLCGGLEGDHPTFSTVLFEQSKVSFDDFVLHLQVKMIQNRIC
jgi:hypothetical protein